MKKILVLFFASVALISISITTILWANAYDGIFILKNMDRMTALYPVIIGCITFVSAVVCIKILFDVLNTAHQQEMQEIHKLG